MALFAPPRRIDLSRSWHSSFRKKRSFLLLFVGMVMMSLLVIKALGGSIRGMRNIRTEATALEGQGKEALASLLQGVASARAFDIPKAQEGLQRAAVLFSDAAHELDATASSFPLLSWFPFVNSRVATARQLLSLGRDTANLAHDLTLPFVAALQQSEGIGRGEVLLRVATQFSQLTSRITHVLSEVRTINTELLPVNLQNSIRQSMASLKHLEDQVRLSASLISFLHTWAGGVSAKRYLVVFQNNAELRPTGGFMGSLAVVDILKGNVTRMELPKGGVYDIAGQVPVHVTAPQPLWLVNPNWNIQDANWFPDVPTSARKILWFWDHAGGESVDGMVFITPNVLVDLLAFTGPLVLGAPYDVTLTSDNVIEELQVRTSGKSYETTTPKEILGEAAPLLLERLMSLPGSDLPKLLDIFRGALAKKDIMLYMQDQELQRFVVAMGFGGDMKPCPQDCLAVVRANIRGEKTDRVISESLHHQVRVASDGVVTSSLELTRSHTGIRGEKFTGVRHTSYIRFYVPQGAVLLSAQGFSNPPRAYFETPDPLNMPDEDLVRVEGEQSIDAKTGAHVNQELGRTVFGFWDIVEPGETHTLRITYRVPFRVLPNEDHVASYTLVSQKQPGLKPLPVTFNISIPHTTLEWADPVVKEEVNGTLSLSVLEQQDRAVSVVVRTPI